MVGSGLLLMTALGPQLVLGSVFWDRYGPGKRDGIWKTRTDKDVYKVVHHNPENPIAVIETDMGITRVEIFLDVMPITASNFIDLANKRFYDGLHIHSVTPNYIVQLGCPFTRDPLLRTKQVGTGRPEAGSTFLNYATGETMTRVDGYIPDEFVVELSNQPGTVSMASLGDLPNTGGSQFFFNVHNNHYLDYFDKALPKARHPVFGQVIENYPLVVNISEVIVKKYDRLKPQTPIEIIHVSIEGLLGQAKAMTCSDDALKAEAGSAPKEPGAYPHPRAETADPAPEQPQAPAAEKPAAPAAEQPAPAVQAPPAATTQTQPAATAATTPAQPAPALQTPPDAAAAALKDAAAAIDSATASMTSAVDAVDGAGRRRRRLQASAALDDTTIFVSSWRQRLACWWGGLPLPTQQQLSGCLGALSLHLGSRLDLAAGRAPGAPAAGAAAAEPGCDFVRKGAAQLDGLPDFPALGEDGALKLTLPALLPLLPHWQRLLWQEALEPAEWRLVLSPAERELRLANLPAALPLPADPNGLLSLGWPAQTRSTSTAASGSPAVGASLAAGAAAGFGAVALLLTAAAGAKRAKRACGRRAGQPEVLGEAAAGSFSA